MQKMPAAAFYIGSYSIPSPWAGAPKAHGDGVRRAELDLESGEIVIGTTESEINPSFLARDGLAGLLWATTEPEFGGELICYREEQGRLSLVGRTSTGADAPCHLVIDRGRGIGFVAHYHGGVVAAVSLGEGGQPRETLALLAPPGTARGENRGARARPHASLLLPRGELLVTDTGRDLVLLYKINGRASTAAFVLLDALPLPVGAGPRHAAHRSGRDVFYVSNQNSGDVSIVARVETNEGPRLELRRMVSAPSLGRARSTPSEIALHPTQNVLYMANRGDNSLSIYGIEAATGGLVAWGCVDVMGRNPRHFGVSPDGRHLIVANQDSDELTTFRLSGDGREATWTGRRFAVATPTAICF